MECGGHKRESYNLCHHLVGEQKTWWGNKNLSHQILDKINFLGFCLLRGERPFIEKILPISTSDPPCHCLLPLWTIHKLQILKTLVPQQNKGNIILENPKNATMIYGQPRRSFVYQRISTLSLLASTLEVWKIKKLGRLWTELKFSH